MTKQVVPFDTLVRVHHQHTTNHVLYLRMHPKRENHRVLLYLLQQVDYVRSSIWHPNSKQYYFPKSIS